MAVIDQRKHPRFRVPATVLVARGAELLDSYLAHDVSAGGTLIYAGAELFVGETVRTLLHLPGQEAITTEARIVREAVGPDGGPAYGLAFLHPSEEAEQELVQAMERVRAYAESKRESAVLVVDRCADSRAALGRDLLRLGRDVVFAENAEEARQALDSELELDAVLADLSDETSELMERLAVERPSVRRVLLTEDLGAGAVGALAKLMPVHALLRRPWDARALAKVVMAPSVDTAPASSPLGEKRVLLVGDISTAVPALARLADERRVSISVASTLLSANLQIDKHIYDLVICSERLPGGCGVAFLERVRARQPRACRVLMKQDRGPVLADAVNRAQVSRILFRSSSRAVLQREISELLQLQPDSAPALAGSCARLAAAEMSQLAH